MVIVDTVMAAGGVDVNDNDAVVRFYVEVLRPLAERFGLAVVILHHERKPGAQEKRNAGFAMMGARQWAGQADVHMTLTPVSDYTEAPREGGGVDTHKEFRFSVEKGRDGHSARPERTVVRSVKDARYRLISMEVEWLGRIEEGAQEALRDAILRALAGAPGGKLDRKAAAAAAGQSDPSTPDGTFKRAWKSLTEGGYADKAGNGLTLTDDGRIKAEALGLEV